MFEIVTIANMLKLFLKVFIIFGSYVGCILIVVIIVWSALKVLSILFDI